LFDLDHTLLDTDRAEKAALRLALATLGLPLRPATLATYREINGALWERYRRGEIQQHVLAKERFRQLLVHLGAEPRRAPSLAGAYLKNLSGRGDVLPGCRTMLRRLRRRYHLGIVTNGIDRVQRSRLRAARLESLFDVIVTSEGCGYTKPDPRILKVALRALGLRPREALYVGDDVQTDGTAASRAGVPFLWLVRTAQKDSGGPRRRAFALLEVAEALHA